MLKTLQKIRSNQGEARKRLRKGSGAALERLWTGSLEGLRGFGEPLERLWSAVSADVSSEIGLASDLFTNLQKLGFGKELQEDEVRQELLRSS